MLVSHSLQVQLFFPHPIQIKQFCFSNTVSALDQMPNFKSQSLFVEARSHQLILLLNPSVK